MNKYAIFIDDCEIHIDLEIGTIDSLDAIREVIAEEMKAHPNFEHGVVEHYPFWRGYWEVVEEEEEEGEAVVVLHLNYEIRLCHLTSLTC